MPREAATFMEEGAGILLSLICLLMLIFLPVCLTLNGIPKPSLSLVVLQEVTQS